MIMNELLYLFIFAILLKKKRYYDCIKGCKKEMDELGIEPKTSPMLRERATNYATRP